MTAAAAADDGGVCWKALLLVMVDDDDNNRSNKRIRSRGPAETHGATVAVEANPFDAALLFDLMVMYVLQ